MITVKDLKDQTETIENRPILFCPNCGAEHSANAGDYFMASPDHVFTCCDRPMLLVIKRIGYEVIK